MDEHVEQDKKEETREPQIEVESVYLADDTEALEPVLVGEEPEDEPEGSKQPDRRQTFQTLGILLVWYYVYQLFKGLFAGEITGNERIFAIAAVAIMTVANLWLSINIGKRYWEQYKHNRDSRDR